MKVNIKKLNENAVIPTYGSEYSAGADLYACIEQEVTILPGETKLIKTGLAIEVPVGYGAFIYARSGLASKRGLAPANKVGVVDADYYSNEGNDGNIGFRLLNLGSTPYEIKVGDRIGQGVFIKYGTIKDDNTTSTRTGGFGSTN